WWEGMSRRLAVCVTAILVTIGFGVTPSDAERTEGIKDTLGQLGCIDIVVEKTNGEMERRGVTEESLTNAVLVRLKAKVPRLDMRASCSNMLYLNVHFRSDPRGYYGNMDLKLHRK